jgi:LAO/AO transport system kinase
VFSEFNPNPTGPRRRELSLPELVAGIRSADIPTLARAVTIIESSNPRHLQMAEELLIRLLPFTGGSVRVGITGVPGAGKSTFIEALGMYLIGLGRRVAVLAIDPSSGLTGGSILGDKTRMPRLAAAPGAYIRPSPSAGTLGGVARKTRESLLLCEAAGFDVVLVETVGVGQSETVVADMTDCFLGLMLPGAGDELQGIKRGLLELVDVIAVNKADGPLRTLAEIAARQYQNALRSLAGRHTEPPTVLTCSALEGRNIDAVWRAIDERQQTLIQRGELAELRRRQNLRWLWSLVDDQLRQAVQNHPRVQQIRGELEQQVLTGQLPASAAARRILEAFRSS